MESVLDGRIKPVPRRSVLNWLLGGALATFTGSVLYPVIRYLFPPQTAETSKEWVEVAPVEDIPVGMGAKKVAYANKPVWVIQPALNEFRALSAICTHLGCIVAWQPQIRHFVSPCHNGHFDVTGAVVSGPPPRPLPLYKVEVKGGKVYLGSLREGERLYGA